MPYVELTLNAGMKYHPELNAFLSPAMLYGLPVAYLVLAIGGHFVMANRKEPSWVKPAMQVYNVAQVALCIYMAWGMAPVLGWPNLFGIGTAYTPAAEWFIFVHYLSKYMDWCDTLWMVLKKKSSIQMSFLHLYHHATIGVVWGFLLSLGHGNGTAQYGAFINSVTHVIMYTHYFVTGLGINNPLKNLVTKWQIAQFYSCFLHALCVLFFVPGLETYFPYQLAWLQFGYHLTMIYLFTFKLRWVPAFLKTGEKKK
jgi:elongation of very long chain fatty acids protein 4|mmetsp:Transcript_5611/g.10211  ORF Transcript_5611/g.10211 Transcript_5611/m.10211 type:complete len:255 (-) Transcript_5611:1478-2242(-)|eukprot:CAMPEP_0174300092 /NCGR_PEP_ID=MMETSP0809-20121228/58268_1 /TAXON_ID=73025 ORGANISM="Eutreptiella gymnastica-like, Strain CCMP1594" /NCGR_SAMPLE_ID=MMETSP0809 /ASSEMBLY_ACC=CAM_ASM_000658 /LENGTH=254 /DNA_ID=CAMNT_0015405625 /DNA_START=46 /DNA_END=810 /DNA_ORIENTATION=-